LITFNADKDVAVLWVDPAAFREAVVAPLLPNEAASKVVVGQRVFTIGNPLGREKVLTTGVISKVEKAPSPATSASTPAIPAVRFLH
jgi:S1-C subfamily serine protease